MATSTNKSDGTFSFYGGMDLSRVSYEIDSRQFAKGINLSITTVGDNIQPRPGWHWQTVQWNSPLEQEKFETGHVQGGSWYFDGNSDCLVVSVSGLIYFFNQKTQGHWYGKAINLGNPNNSTRTKVYTCRIPGNRLIVSDGQSLPYILGLGGAYTRTDPNANQLGVTLMMAYIQNRLWWVNETATAVFFSDLQDPLSTQEMVDLNLFGFVPPDDRERITAVGTQRYFNLDQNGGELVFSTEQNVYAVSVPANIPPNFWRPEGAGLVRLVIANAGATSAFSFENYNVNLFYRTQATGLVNFKQTQAQWQNSDELISNSIEVDYYFRNDTPWMLDQVYSVNFRGRLLTTVSPTLTNGYCYFRGLISMNPAPYYGSMQRLPRRFEGLWTGCRPWILMHQQNTIEKLFTVSFDGDGKNRIYEMVEDRYDIGPDGKRKDIECILETRSYAFDSIYQLKSLDYRYYTLDRILTDVKVRGYSRSTLSGSWWPFYSITHQVGACCPEQALEDERGNKICYPWNIVAPEARNGWALPSEVEKSSLGISVDRFYFKQYRFELEGEFEMSAFGANAVLQPNPTSSVTKEGKRVITKKPECPKKDFQYLVVEIPVLTPACETVSRSQSPTSPAPSCGCS
jgi:hypothetical protein